MSATTPQQVTRNGRSFFYDPSVRGIPDDPLHSELYTNFWFHMYSQDWEADTLRVFDLFLDAGHSLVDIGAWIGATPLYGALSARRVVALEPDPVAYRALERNLAVNPSIRNISILEAALAPVDGKVQLGGNGSLGNSESTLLVSDEGYGEGQGMFLRTGTIADERAWRGTAAVEVPGISIESLFRLYELSDCGLVKMDIEGGEKILAPAVAPFLAARRLPLSISLHRPYLNEEEFGSVVACLFQHFPTIYGSRMSLLHSAREVLQGAEDSLLCTAP